MAAASSSSSSSSQPTAPAATDAATDSERQRPSSQQEQQEQQEVGTVAAPKPTTELLDAHDTTLTACALEACYWPPILPTPSTSEAPSSSSSSCCWVVCGTYQLVKGGTEAGSSQGDRREGSLLLYQLGEEEEASDGGSGKGQRRRVLVPRQRVALKEEGVLDCKWRPRAAAAGGGAGGQSPPLLACATSEGRIATYMLQAPTTGGDGEGGGLLQLVPGPASRPLSGDGGGGVGERTDAYMALALEWARGSEAVVASSNNDGTACVHRLRDEGAALVEDVRWDAHSLYGSPIEVWTTAFADKGGNLLLTGGDDCALRAWDLRCLDPATPTPVWSDTRSHGAGVTSLQAFGGGGGDGEDGEEESWYFASGSYDGVLRLWDRRKPGRPVLLHQTDVGGGIWRIKWHPSAHHHHHHRQTTNGQRRLLALACMHAGAAVLRSPDGGDEVWESFSEPEVVARHEGHASMAYGIDWCLEQGGDEGEGEGEGGALLASCSFYDHALHLWRPVSWRP